ncbi:hypothetical protein QQM79_17790 [Marinobacteraceae bacterium S3BR75-40.1]
MRVPPPSPMRALSSRRLSVWLSVMIIGVLVWVLLGRLEREAGRSEEQLLRMHLNEIRMQLVLDIALWRIHGKRQSLQALLQRDPLKAMEEPPPGYIGDCPAAIPQKPGLWCFDAGRNELVYRPHFITTFEGRPLTGEGVWRWRVSMDAKDDSNLSLEPVIGSQDA